MSPDRAVSTVLDVALALLLVSAGVLLIGAALDGSDEGLEETRADRTAETLAGSSASIVYDLEAVTESEHYEEPDHVEQYERTSYGPAVGLLADAAVANASVGDDERLFLYADSVVASVAANVESRLVGANHHVYVRATWRPYENASIDGTAAVGERPPPTADTNVVTTTPSSGMPAVDSAELAEAYAVNESSEDLAEPIAESIVHGYFPPEQSQLALERQNLDRAVTVTHYLRAADLVDRSDELERGSPPLKRTDAHVAEANARLIEGLTELIADDIESNSLGEKLETIGDDEGELEALFETTVDPSKVDLTIYTWDP